MRMPMIGVGWGYDLNNNPVPSGSGENGFAEDYLYNQGKWKAGPIDLRWDNFRKVWGLSSSLRYGIVSESHGRGYYSVQLSTWSGTAPSGAEDSLCDILSAQAETGPSGEIDCGATITLPVFSEIQDTGTDPMVKRQTIKDSPETTVLAFDCASIFIPLTLWSDVLIADIGLTNKLPSGVDPSGFDETEKIYQVVNGLQEHIILYNEDWDCCDGVLTKVSRIPNIVAGITCDDLCNGCPTPS